MNIKKYTGSFCYKNPPLLLLYSLQARLNWHSVMLKRGSEKGGKKLTFELVADQNCRLLSLKR